MYWSKGFFFNGQVIPFQNTVRSFCKKIEGLHLPLFFAMLRRFELNFLYYDRNLDIPNFNTHLYRSFNIYFSQLSSVNNQVKEITRFSLVRLYLLKTTRGKAQALGKPSRGQRTWSNAWTAFHYNKTIRNFVYQVQRGLRKDKKEEQINFKVLKKKTRKPKTKKVIIKVKKKLNVWF
jgi:ribosomal protein S13